MANIISTTFNFFPDDPMSEEVIITISGMGFKIVDDTVLTGGFKEMVIGFSFNAHLREDQISFGFNDGNLPQCVLENDPDEVYKLQSMFRKAIMMNKMTIVPTYGDNGLINGIDFYAGSYSKEVHDIVYELGEYDAGSFSFLSTDPTMSGGILNEISINNDTKTDNDLSEMCFILTGVEILELYNILSGYNLFDRKER